MLPTVGQVFLRTLIVCQYVDNNYNTTSHDLVLSDWLSIIRNPLTGICYHKQSDTAANGLFDKLNLI